MVRDADNDAAGKVERDDHQRRDRIALDELSGAVHSAVEVGFALNHLSLAPRAFAVEHAGVNVGIDGHLLPRHCIERKARRDLGDALRAAGDNHELYRHQDRKDDQTDDEIAAHHEGAERRNDAPDGIPASHPRSR